MVAAPSLYFTQDFTTQLDDLLILICEELQISEARYKQADERYHSVNTYLEAERSPFYAFKPLIYPQGSMRLNTTVKPIEGPHDLDFVLELAATHDQVEPMKLLRSLYLYLQSNEIYRPMLSQKNRCVRLDYANEFYMDILIGCKSSAAHEGCIKVPDRQAKTWKDSNPRGYARWFETRCALFSSRLHRVMDAAAPIPDQQSVAEKTPLQLAVQLLKRWRDLRYKGSELAPISVVLTTMAGHQYAGQQSVSEAFRAILDGIVAAIGQADSRFDRIRVHNPSNTAEDLSERWDDNPDAYRAFTKGIRELQQQWLTIVTKKGNVADALEKLFGETVKTAYTKQARRLQADHEKGKLGVTSSGAIAAVSSTAIKTPQHTFFGDEE